MRENRILVVDDDPVVLESLLETLKIEGYDVVGAETGRKALKHVNQQEFGAVLLDVALPDISGLSVLAYVRKHVPGLPVVLMTGFGSVPDAVSAARNGAIDYVLKPVSMEKLRHQLKRVLQMGSRSAGVSTETGVCQSGPILGRSSRMRHLWDLVTRCAHTDATILITGEPGSGKTLIARYLQRCSRRADRRFVEVDVMNLVDALLESELYGHVRGAFTGADTDRVGKFELADGGTLLLDNIERASWKLQTNLLDVLESRSFEPVGGTGRREVDVRLILTGTPDLADRVSNGQFREDLFHRVNKVVLEVPGLREHQTDIPVLVKHFMQQFEVNHGRHVAGVTDECMDVLTRYAWPGNVRELESTIEQACLRCDGIYLQGSDLPAGVRQRATGGRVERVVPLRRAMDACEKELIEWALLQTGGNRQLAAGMLEMNRTTLSNKLRKHGIRPGTLRNGDRNGLSGTNNGKERSGDEVPPGRVPENEGTR